MLYYKDIIYREVLSAVEEIKENVKGRNIIIDARRVRVVMGTPSSDRSSINFIWRALERLEEESILEYLEGTQPKKYIISPKSR